MAADYSNLDNPRAVDSSVKVLLSSIYLPACLHACLLLVGEYKK